LGERILNQLFLELRDDYKDSLGYRLYGKKNSITNWPHLIAVLQSWDVLLPDVADAFLELEGLRHRAVHYSAGVEENARDLALKALRQMHLIVQRQFGAFGRLPWILGGVPGEMYIKKEFERKPFIKHIVLPSCLLLGPWHKYGDFKDGVFQVHEQPSYPDREITDEEFCALRNEFTRTGRMSEIHDHVTGGESAPTCEGDAGQSR
jgi:hypothetical protein